MVRTYERGCWGDPLYSFATPPASGCGLTPKMCASQSSRPFKNGIHGAHIPSYVFWQPKVMRPSVYNCWSLSHSVVLSPALSCSPTCQFSWNIYDFFFFGQDYAQLGIIKTHRSMSHHLGMGKVKGRVAGAQNKGQRAGFMLVLPLLRRPGYYWLSGACT